LNLRWRFKLLKLYWNEENGGHNVGPLLLSFLETAGQGPVGWVIALHIDRPKFVDRPKVISREKAPCEVFFCDFTRRYRTMHGGKKISGYDDHRCYTTKRCHAKDARSLPTGTNKTISPGTARRLRNLGLASLPRMICVVLQAP
jgi:hypothetical protein